MNINRITEEKQLLKKGIAERAGMSQQMWSDILAERKIVRADMIPRIAYALGCEIGELFKENAEASA